MLRMRRITQILSAAAVAAIAVQASQAAITVSAVQIPLAGSTFYGDVLNANGWTSYEIVLTADATSGTVSGFDFFTPAGTGGNSAGNVGFTGKNWGIFGTFAQDWAPATKKSPAVPSVSADVSGITSPNDGFDSFFNAFPAALSFTPVDAAVEDNNLLTTTANPPYTASPDQNDSVDANGVGTFLKADGAFKGPTQGGQSLVIAYVIVPKGVPFTVEGISTDGSAQAVKSGIDATFNNIPEPASLGALALGGLAFVARRRRKA